MPSPVAEFRPSEPPNSIGLPVTTPGTAKPLACEYVSIIQPISRSPVPTSEAGMSLSGPIIGSISVVYLLVNLSSSPKDSSLGSTFTPPFAPP